MPTELFAISPELAGPDGGPVPTLVTVDTAPDVSPVIVSMLKRQPDILSAAQSVRAQFANVSEEQSQYFPSVSVGLSSELTGDTGSSPALQLTGSQMLYDFGRVDRSVSTQVRMAQKSHLDFLDTVDNQLVELLRVIAEFESQKRQIALGQDRLAAMERYQALVQNRAREGAADSNSIIAAQRKVQTVETVLLRTELAATSSKNTIEAETGISIGTSDAIGLDLSGLGCGSVPLDINTLTDVQSAEIDLLISQLDVQSARTSRLPTISLDASARQDLSDLSDQSGVGVTLNVETSLFRGGANQAQTDAASRNAAAAQATVASIRQTSQRTYESALENTESQNLILSSLRSELQLMDETRALYLQQFLELGTKEFDDVLDVEEEYHQALLEIETTRLELVTGQIECLAAEGRLREFFGVENTQLHGLALRT